MPAIPRDVDSSDDSLPIDILYGCSSPTERATTLFVKRIEQDAPTFGLSYEDLLEIVRMHEHAHAIVHLGVAAPDIEKLLSANIMDGQTEWADFVSVRDKWFARTSSEVHEYLAQAITHASLSRIKPNERATSLLQAFDRIEARQPQHYHITNLCKQYSAKANWATILRAVRGELGGNTPEGFTMLDGIEALGVLTSGNY